MDKISITKEQYFAIYADAIVTAVGIAWFVIVLYSNYQHVFSSIGAVVIAILISAMLSKKSKALPEPTFTDAMQRVRDKVLSLLELPERDYPNAYEQFKILFDEYQELKKMRERAQNTWSKNGKQPDEN